MSSTERPLLVGSGEFTYRLQEGFAANWIMDDAAGVAVDSQDRVYVLNRSVDHPVIVLDSEGNRLRSWGAGMFRRAHAIFSAGDDTLYCVDDQGHSVRQFTTDGELLLEISTADHPADTGYVPGQLDSVSRAGPPFNTPTGVAVTTGGDILVSDGYGNACIHRFNRSGELLNTFGEPGHGPGQFFLPHGVAVDQDDRILVADRENSRVQVFLPDGTFVDQWVAPRASCFLMDPRGYLFVTEMGEVMQGPAGNKHLAMQLPRARVTVRDAQGEVLAELLPGDPEGAGLFFSPHSIAQDSWGNLYVSEVSDSFSGGLAPRDRPRLHKYFRN